MSALRRSAVATSRATRASVEVERERIRVNRDIGAADAALLVRHREFGWIEAGLRDDRRIAGRGPLSHAIDGGESLGLGALDLVQRAADERKARRWVEIVCRSRHTRCRERRVRGQRAQGVPGLVDRVRLDGPRLEVGLRKRGVSARGVVHACAGGRRRSESLDGAESVGRARGRGLAPSGRTRVARLGLGERGDDRAALLEPGLPGHDLVHRALEGIPLKHLPTRGFIEPRARFRQTVLVSRLHFRLPREDCANHVVVEGEVKRDGAGPGE